jgi:hypothetical protein
MKTRSVLTGLFFCLAASLQAEAASLQPIGSTVEVVNLVTAEYNRDTRSLQRGDKVHQDETIEVGLDGSSELKLDDDTKLALGPGSHLKLDKFVYDANKTKGSIVLDLVKGTFRFITGVAEKPTYVIKTPAAAITVRGTIFDVYVEDNGLAWLLLHEGAVQVCNTRGQCKDLDEPGKIIRITDDGDIGAPTRWASLPGKDNVAFDTAFPFVGNAPSIDPTPVLTREAILTGTVDDEPPVKEEKDDYQAPKGTDATPPPPPPKYKTPKKTRETKYEEQEKYPKKKRRSDDDEQVMKGVGAAIGLGLAIGAAKNMGDKKYKHKHKHKPDGYGGGKHKPDGYGSKKSNGGFGMGGGFSIGGGGGKKSY